MYVLINLDKKSIYGFSSSKPNIKDLISINRTAVEYTGELSYDSLRPVIDNGDVISVKEKTKYQLSASTTQINAGGEDRTFVNIKVDDGDEDQVMFKVNDEKVGTVYTEGGTTELEFTADNPGIYTITAESINKRYISNSIDIEVI